ncbi:MAG TPA: hypothetical protein VHB51_02690 [Candidatus Saccharimonadales bacterium]|nr:hypothetical protein [Candidatus Saccharimonadales bacterium]
MKKLKILYTNRSMPACLLRLDAAANFLTSNGLSRTAGTVKGVAQAKIGGSAKSGGGVAGSASKQADGAQKV